MAKVSSILANCSFEVKRELVPKGQFNAQRLAFVAGGFAQAQPGGVGQDSSSKREKPKARQMSKKRGAYQPSGARCAGQLPLVNIAFTKNDFSKPGNFLLIHNLTEYLLLHRLASQLHHFHNRSDSGIRLFNFNTVTALCK